MATQGGRWTSWFWRIAGWPARVAAARRDMALLARLDDCGLADIGLTRQDLRDASALSLSADPTALFAERADERRRLGIAARRPPAVRPRQSAAPRAQAAE